MRHTVRGLIIKDRKVLLVTGHDADFYWMPGGGVEDDESPEQALYREILEELGVTIEVSEPHSTYDYEDHSVEIFLIEIDGDIQPGNEITGVAWYNSNSAIQASNGFKNTILPRLLQENLID